MFDISNYFFFLELSVASLVISLPFYKRDYFGMRFSGAIAVILVLLTLIPNGLAKFWLVTALVCMMQYLCWKIQWRKAVYNTLCAYALQHFTYSLVPVAACIRNVFFDQMISPENLKPGFGVSSWILHIAVYAACYFLLFRKKGKTDVDVSTGYVIVFGFAVLLAVLILNSFLDQYNQSGEYGLILLCHLYDMLCCVIIICLDDGIYRVAVAKGQLDTIRYLWKERQNQYVVAKNNIHVINTKCHELKQQILKIQESGISGNLVDDLEELKNSIGIYDAVVKTGNEVLDVVLTEKSLYCQSEKIVLACVADGKRMDFMDAMDIYFIFETLLDHVVENVCRIPQTEKRQIAISIWTQCGLLLIQVENYVESGMLPYGEYEKKSVNDIVRKYKGTITEHQEGSLFIRRISIPVSDKNTK